MAQRVIRTPAEEFVRYALEIGALELIPLGRPLKSGRFSPYFFNAGLFNSGEAMATITTGYADVISNEFVGLNEEPCFDLLYGPPYKGTILAPAVAMIFTSIFSFSGVSFCTSRKEVKTHGEGGTLIGAPIKEGSRVLIIDDVITDGGTKREAVEFVRQRGGVPVGLVIAFDRQERGAGELSAVQEFERDYEIPVRAIATLSDLISLLEKTSAESDEGNAGEMLDKIIAYRDQYGAS